MQLNLFGELAQPNEAEAGDPYAINAEDIWDLEFGPVTHVEAMNDNAFLSAVPPSAHDSAAQRDEYLAVVRKARLEALLEESLLNDQVFTSRFDGHKSYVKPSFIPIIMDRLNGLSFSELEVKYNKSQPAFRTFFNRPAVRRFMAKLLAEYSVNLGDNNARIMAHATEAIDTVVDIMRSGKEENRQKSAFALLRMAGYDEGKKNEITINNQPFDANIVEKTDRLLDALREANQARDDGHEQYVDKRRPADKREIAMVEAPVGLRKIAAAS